MQPILPAVAKGEESDNNTWEASYRMELARFLKRGDADDCTKHRTAVWALILSPSAERSSLLRT